MTEEIPDFLEYIGWDDYVERRLFKLTCCCGGYMPYQGVCGYEAYGWDAMRDHIIKEHGVWDIANTLTSFIVEANNPMLDDICSNCAGKLQ